MAREELRALSVAMFLTSFSLILFELLLTRLFGVVLFAQFAHLALALEMLGISTGASAQHLFPWLVPDLLHATALGAPLAVRMGLVFLVLLPLGFIMGMPFPLVIRMLPEKASGIVPWAWALNGWMSVVASLATVLISRTWGYSNAFILAPLAYAIALGITGLFHRLKAGAGAA
jgi:hypothetical protein